MNFTCVSPRCLQPQIQSVHHCRDSDSSASWSCGETLGGFIGSGGLLAWGVVVCGGGVRGLGRSSGLGGGCGRESDVVRPSAGLLSVCVVSDCASSEADSR